MTTTNSTTNNSNARDYARASIQNVAALAQEPIGIYVSSSDSIVFDRGGNTLQVKASNSKDLMVLSACIVSAFAYHDLLGKLLKDKNDQVLNEIFEQVESRDWFLSDDEDGEDDQENGGKKYIASTDGQQIACLQDEDTANEGELHIKWQQLIDACEYAQHRWNMIEKYANI